MVTIKDPIKPTRQELLDALNNNFRAVRAIESVLDLVPSEFNSINGAVESINLDTDAIEADIDGLNATVTTIQSDLTDLTSLVNQNYNDLLAVSFFMGR
jgi:hypothetical protein